MKTLKRIVHLLEGIHYQLQLANWQRSNHKSPRPVDPHADPNTRYFNGQPVKTLAEHENHVHINVAAPLGKQAAADYERAMQHRGRTA